MHIMQAVYKARNKHFYVQKVSNVKRYTAFSALLCNLYKRPGCRKKSESSVYWPKQLVFATFLYTYFLHKFLRLFCASLLFATFRTYKPPKTIHFPLFYEHYSKIFSYLSICFSVRAAYTLYIYKTAAVYLTIFQHDKKFDSLKKFFPTRPGVSPWPVDLGGV